MKNHKLFWGSSYDRGLDILLAMWPKIRAKYPDAELHIAYGWEVFDKITLNNAERQEWKKNMEVLMTQPGITHYGRLGKAELKDIRSKCGIWAYPTTFTEIFCITALECQSQGVVPVVSKLAALPTSVGSGVLVAGDILEKPVQEKFLDKLLSLMGDVKRWKEKSQKAVKFAKSFTWVKTASEWAKEFSRRDEQNVKVHIYTPTIRKGFWNIMAKNISEQTYKNIEWVIVDDAPEDRSGVAKKYAKMYGIDIRYMKGKKRAVKRQYSLVNANNTVLEACDDGLLVFLQDFILMPYDGIEQLVRLHKKNPDALLAPVDMYFKPKFKPNKNSDDWFNGETDVIGDFIWANPRIQGVGMRESINPYEFEQNYGAIPVKIAKDLGGWMEVFDFGLGFDNTDMAFRALKAGYRIIVDDTNIATCIDHWETLKQDHENGGMERARRLNDPIFLFVKDMIEEGKLPIIRDPKIDDKLDLTYEVPKEVDDSQMKEWIRDNSPLIVARWIEEKKL